MKNLLLLIFMGSTCMLIAQSTDGLVTYLSMENDTILDSSDIPNSLIVTNSAGFGCGVFGEAAYFDGTTSIEFLTNYNTYFKGNFTLSFDFKPTGNSGKMILFSKSTTCLGTTDFEISFNAGSHTLGVIMSENFDHRLDYSIQLDPNQCWYHVDIVRSSPNSLIYVNNRLVRKSDLDIRIDFTNAGFLSISQSPCIPSRASKFIGYIDEVRLYNRPLSVDELFYLYKQVNSILTQQDTLAYLNTDVPVRVTDDCTDSYSWFPSRDVADPSSGNTIIHTPDVGVYTYTLTFNEQFCSVTDTITIRVVDPGDVSCDNLVMPSAFTPNSDGLNDIYKISNPFIVEELVRFQIFDRNGGLIFQTADPLVGWNGMYKGDYVSSGNYLYRIVHICNGEKQVLQGNVIVLR